MGKPSAVLGSRRGREFLQREIPRTARQLIEQLEQAFKEGDKAYWLQCAQLHFKYCLPQLNAIGIRLDAGPGNELLQQLTRAALVETPELRERVRLLGDGLPGDLAVPGPAGSTVSTGGNGDHLLELEELGEVQELEEQGE